MARRGIWPDPAPVLSASASSSTPSRPAADPFQAAEIPPLATRTVHPIWVWPDNPPVLLLVCFFPFLAVVVAATGRNTQQTITDRLGLSGQAAKDVDALISAGHQMVSTLSVLGASSWFSSRSESQAPCRPGTRRSTTSPPRTAA
jgi:hypothetical protein